MADDTQRIFNLLQNSTIAISDSGVWKYFLKTAAWHYKYSFNDQVLIFAQNSSAKACAGMDDWVNKTHRWVRKDASPIALVRENGSQYYLEYVFDITDTNSFGKREIKLWEYDNRYESAVIQTLSRFSPDTVNTDNLMDTIRNAAHSSIEDRKADYLHDLKYVKSGSFLSGLDDVNLDVRFRQTAEISVIYMVTQRMGLNADYMVDEYDLQYIRDFNTPETMSILGNAVSTIAEDMLRDVARTIHNERKREKFAEKENSVYNENERKNTDIQEERTDKNDERSNIHESGRLSDAESDSTGRGISDRQIRNDAPDVSERTPSDPVFNTDDERRTAETLGGGRQDNNGTGRSDSQEDGESGGRNGSDEIDRPVTMDGTNEQFSPFSGGNRIIGNGIQLSIFDMELPTEAEQKEYIMKAEQTQGSAFSMPQQIIDEVLTTGGNDRDSVLNICIEYSKNKSSAENIIFLKDEYGTGGKGFIFDGNKVSVWWNDEGIRIAYGERANGRGELVSWERVEKRIGELLELGRFAPPETLDQIGEAEYKKAARSFYEMYRCTNTDKYPELLKHFNTEWFSNIHPETVDRIAELFKQSENIDFAINAADEVNKVYANDKYAVAYKVYAPERVKAVLRDLQREHRHFTADEYQASNAARFITEDEIDKLFTRGSGFDRGKIRIYLYFQEHTNPKERSDFLKNEYGTGGYLVGVFNEWHEPKGITFSRSDILSPLAKINITWNTAAKRIDSLIKSGKYLTEREIAEDIPKYQSEQEQQKIRNAKYDYLHEMLTDKWDSVSKEERLQTLPKRLSYFTDLLENSDKKSFESHWIENLIGETEIGFGEAIKNGETRECLIHTMNDLKGKSTGITAGCAYKFAEELSEIKSVTLERVGDFYEIYGEEATEAAKVLDLTLTQKMIDGENLPMVGFPSHIAEKYTQILNENGYLVAFWEDSKEQEIENVSDSGNGEFIQTDSDILRAYTVSFIRAVMRDEKYLEATTSGDTDLIRQECENAVNRAVSNLPTENNERFHTLFSDNLDFRQKFYDNVFKSAYTDMMKIIENTMDRTNRPVRRKTREERNYELLSEFAPEILDGTSTYMRFTAGESFMPLVIERLGNDRISVTHYYEQNGDSMSDPDMTFVFDNEAQTLSARTYQQDNMGLYQDAENGEVLNTRLVAELNSFANTWFRNIKNQEYVKERMKVIYHDDDIEILYDKNGNITGLNGEVSLIEQYKKENNITVNEYSVGEHFYISNGKSGTSEFVITEIKDYAIFYTFPDLPEQTPTYIDRDEFEANIHRGIITRADNNIPVYKDESEEVAQIRYRLLDRLRSDCEYFLGAGGRNEKHLWAESVQEHIAKMRELYNLLPEKPEWLSEQDIDRYAENMLNVNQEQEQAEDYSQYIGREIAVDDRKFVVESIGDFGKVSLRDVTFQQGVGFPIFRSESIEWLRAVVEQQQAHEDTFDDIDAAEIKANLEKVGIKNGQVVDTEALERSPFIQQVTQDVSRPVPVRNVPILPEIPMSERHNFHITDDELGYGTLSEKYKANVTAIRTLKKIESENRLATPEEQEILSRYVGWGGLADCFEEKHIGYNELKSLLNDDEYAQARASVLTSHYTPPVVIKAMYKAMENMGFKQGNILEPSCGIGNFMGLMPESISDSKIYGIEIDSITGRIAQQLYQKNTIAVQGYEESTLPDSFFDVAIGNVPFGNFKVMEKKYDKHNFLIHDFFFAKTLDKVRPGGIVAFITSSGTMDKQNSKVRKYIAQRADLVGAIRLPNNTFKKNAGTEVTADILFLQKRDRITDIEPDWVHIGQHETGQPINQYFLDNPDMVLGELVEESGQYGMQLNCKPYENADLGELLDRAIQNIHAEITEYEFDDISENEDLSIPADPNVKNFSYTIVDGDIYFRENSRMNKVQLNATAEKRVRGMIELRDCVRQLIEYQTEDFPDYEIKKQQYKLNELYDNFTKKYGLINSRGNNMAFSSDSSYFLLCSLEELDDDGNLKRKADMFTKRTIGAKKDVTHVDTASEALAVSIGEKARVDMEFMSELSGKTEQELFEDLKGVIFLNPEYTSDNDGRNKYLPADEYLSGNVRKKLEIAKQNAELNPNDYAVNVEALEAVQPKDLTASEITVRLGTTWIPTEYIKQFTFELLNPSPIAKSNIDIHYSKITGNWNVSGKSSDRGNIKINSTYGTHRANALRIIEDTLNLRDVRIFDYKDNEDGKRVAVLNHKETTIAQQKQEAIKAAFDNWIWKDPDRRNTLVKMYNEKFNSIRTREYDGSHITFSGMNPEIQLRQHQKDAVARIMYGGNSLLGHVVGAGKTWTMAAAAMESKRLGLCNKPMFVVPNHLTEQWASEFLQLYPAANILVTTKKDFEMKNRKKFCGRIATGDYDAIIIGHSQFEKIPMSVVRQKQILSRQLNEIMNGIAEAKSNNAERFTVKQMERTRKSIKAKIDKLNKQDRKDDVVTFEELGVDRMFVDEAHNYKNLFLVTKMRNVGGIAQTDAQKSSDMFMKCQYLDELTGNKGNIFATGTPISNSMVELYTMQRYLQYDMLADSDLEHFDAWASTYGETVTAIELAPEGTGYRAKTRFAKFFNIPELMNMFREVADIKTADMLNLPVPEAEYHTIAVEPTEMQSAMVEELGNRAEEIRRSNVDPTVDNMLKITNDGRKLALDQRLINDMLPDEDGTKVSACANNVFEIWKKTADFKGTQLVFCDSSTPKKDGSFNVYDDIRSKLIAKGVPESDIAFIHDADTDVRKKELFAKVRSGDVRILLGSTQKMGAGTNVQTLLYASHDLDCPWRPSDLEQRAGRIVRQGNTNDTVHIYRYVTKDTFDSYSYQLVENKQKFISQIMTSKSPVRSAEDIDETALSYAEIKALATGNPHIKEKMELDTEVAKLKLLKSSFMSEIYELEDKVIKFYPQEIQRLTEQIAGAGKDIERVNHYPKIEDKFYPMTIDGTAHTEKDAAGTALIERCKTMTSTDPAVIGEYRGFTMILSFDSFYQEHKLTLQNSRSYTISLGDDVFGNIQRIDNALASIPKLKEECEQKLTETKKQFEIAKVESKKEFPREAELNEKQKRLAELDSLLNMDKKGNDGIAMSEPDEMDMPPKQRSYDMER